MLIAAMLTCSLHMFYWFPKPQPANEVKYITSKAERQKILKACHMEPTGGHMGIKHTLSRITDRFMWQGVAKDVDQLVSHAT